MLMQGSTVQTLSLTAGSMTALAACGIAQQYFSATFVSLRFHSRK
jgi:hypothetical protein